MSATLQAVLDAVAAGATSREEVGRRTGLDRDLVGLAVEELLRLGRLEQRPLLPGCPGAGCRFCHLGRGGEAALCDVASGSVVRQIVVVDRETSSSPPTGTFHG